MGFDPSVLLQSQGVQLPNPLDLATKGLTLGNLATSNQLNQMNLQGMQQYANAIPGLVSQNWSPEAIQQAAQQNPLGFAKAMQEYKAQQLVQAQMAEAQGKAAQAQAEAKKIAIKDLTTLAYQFGDKPDAGPKDFKQFKFMADSYGFPVSDPPSATASPTEWQGYFKNWGSAAVTPKEGVDIKAIQSKLPGEVANLAADFDKKQAETGKAREETKYVGMRALADQTQAGAAASNAATHRLDVVAPKVDISAADGYPKVVDRFAQGGPSVGAIPGAPQMQPTAMQKDLAGVTAKEVGDLQNKAMAAQQGQQVLKVMQDEERKGILSGGIQGSDTFKRFANVWAGTGLASKAQLETLANTQAWDAKSGELVATMVKQLGGARITNNELNFIRNIKPSTMNSEAGRAQMYDILNKSFQNQVDTASQASDYVQKPGQYTLGGFKPNVGGGSLVRNQDGTYTYQR